MTQVRVVAVKDRLSVLPSNVIDHSLEVLTVHEAARTSILSKKWRYIWAKLPNLVLDKQFCMKFAKKSQNVFKPTIDMILLQHLGDIVKFYLDVSEVHLSTYADIDRWMLYVTRNGIKKLKLNMTKDEFYTISVPLLAKLTIELCDGTQYLNILFLSELKSLVIIESRYNLDLNRNCFKNCVVPNRLPCTLSCLWHLNLGVNFNELGQISYTLELIKVSPIYVNLRFGMRIYQDKASSSKEQLNVATELMCFPRVSPKAELIYQPNEELD
ncbi:hypothetical protein RDI58_010493 [Solanum bulbocastanum]|uniref:Uncharacterized protein n=1 Tax=Solanum bulbocastanum TaxID=147425 RepID=A0AAN8YGF0_SOLBU